MKGYALRKMLWVKLGELQAQNRAYSLRAFAKRLELSPTSLSLLLNGKRYPSYKMAEKICQTLKVTSEEHQEVMDSYKKNPTDFSDKLPTEIYIQEKLESWQRELDEYLSSSEKGRLYQVNVSIKVLELGQSNDSKQFAESVKTQ